ncbi:hypothetical protein [Bacillus yunxiaonensis]|uniref:hypothetical protein n=1 Tax=Bacillus yunxiaonensis TaxID=3127665 RepID=UPI0039B76F29
MQEKDKKYFLENNGAWNSNPLTEYEGYWTTTHSNPEKDVFASISVQVDPNNEHEAIVKIDSNERGSRNVASVTGKVQFTNSKGILTFENDGWGNAGTVEIKLDNDSINLNIKINKKEMVNGVW